MTKLFIVVASILFSFQGLASSMSGVFMVVKGSVSLKNAAGTSPVKVGTKVNEGDTIITAADSRARVVMQDRNVINLNPDSELKIEKYKNDGTNKNVELNLLKGKTRNNVEQSYDGEKNKFLIKTPTAVAGVRGTQYVASFDLVTQSSNFTVLKGSIEVMPARVPGASVTSATRLGAGETVKVDKGAANIQPQRLPASELNNIDADTMSSGGKSSQSSSREIASVEGGGAQNSDGSMTNNTPENSGTAGGANSANPEPKQPTRMVSTEDVSVKNANNIQDPVARVASPVGIGAPPIPVSNQPTAPAADIKEIIRNVNGAGKIIVRPVPQ